MFAGYTTPNREQGEEMYVNRKLIHDDSNFEDIV